MTDINNAFATTSTQINQTNFNSYLTTNSLSRANGIASIKTSIQNGVSTLHCCDHNIEGVLTDRTSPRLLSVERQGCQLYLRSRCGSQLVRQLYLFHLCQHHSEEMRHQLYRFDLYLPFGSSPEA